MHKTNRRNVCFMQYDNTESQIETLNAEKGVQRHLRAPKITICGEIPDFLVLGARNRERQIQANFAS